MILFSVPPDLIRGLHLCGVGKRGADGADVFISMFLEESGDPGSEAGMTALFFPSFCFCAFSFFLLDFPRFLLLTFLRSFHLAGIVQWLVHDLAMVEIRVRFSLPAPADKTKLLEGGFFHVFFLKSHPSTSILSLPAPEGGSLVEKLINGPGALRDTCSGRLLPAKTMNRIFVLLGIPII